jgi:phosphatidate phosphatase PAH1
MIKCKLQKGTLFVNDVETNVQMYFSNEGVAYFEYEKMQLDSDEENMDKIINEQEDKLPEDLDTGKRE